MKHEPKGYTVWEVKEFLKELAQTIRALKRLRKLEKNQRLDDLDPEIVEKAREIAKKGHGATYEAKRLKEVFRHTHIAYCEFRGKTRDQIEPKTDHPASDTWIHGIKNRMIGAMEQYRAEREQEALCAGS